jgi:hypothetical protein
MPRTSWRQAIGTLANRCVGEEELKIRAFDRYIAMEYLGPCIYV